MTEEEKIEAERLAEEKRLEEENIKDQAIKDLKTKLDAAVDPVEHAKLKADYKKLMSDFVNKRPAPKAKEKVLRPAKVIAKELSSIQSGDISNREYIKKTLEYRDSHIAEFGTDPFADGGEEGAGEATPDSIEVAGKLQKLVDESTSPVDFRIKMNSVLKDDSKLVSAINKRRNKRK